MAESRRTSKYDKGSMKTIPYGHQWIDEGDIEEVVKVLKSDWLTQGSKVKEFEEDLCKYTGVKYAVAVSSGTAALHIACLAARIKSGDEVITSPITFVASANCVLYCGATPVFADIQKDTVNIDPEEIKRKLSKKTKAIIPVHLAGHPCESEEIYRIAKKNNLLIIEDAAHALGSEYKSSKLGSCKYSDMATLSFHPVKLITTGEGGAVLTNRKDLYERLLMLRNHGITKDRKKMKKDAGPWYYEQQYLGFNYRITDFQCALGISQLKKIGKFVKRRRQIAKIYREELSEIKGMELPIERDYVRSAWHLYYIRLDGPGIRKDVYGRLKKEGIGCQIHYIPVYLQPYYRKNLGYKKGDCPAAEQYYRRCISIPIFPKMRDDDVYKVVGVLRRCF